MGNYGHSTIVVEGANAKKVYDFLLEMAKIPHTSMTLNRCV